MSRKGDPPHTDGSPGVSRSLGQSGLEETHHLERRLTNGFSTDSCGLPAASAASHAGEPGVCGSLGSAAITPARQSDGTKRFGPLPYFGSSSISSALLRTVARWSRNSSSPLASRYFVAYS